MKRILTNTIVSLAMLATCHADEFQIKKEAQGAKIDVGYAKVKIETGNSPGFEGRTDKYGRISVNLPKGKHEAVVTSGTNKVTVELVVDGDKKLKQTIVKEK